MLTLQFVPYREIDSLDSNKRIAKLLKLVRDDKIILLEGHLKSSEETELIKKTMEEIDNSFKGIELAVIFPDENIEGFLKKIKASFVNLILGDRRGMTIIGPANVVKEIKQDPDKIQLFTQDLPDKKRRR